MVDHDLIETSPIRRKLKKLEEDNIRNKSLKIEEFNKLISYSDSPLREMLYMAFFTAMRQSEIMKLTWDRWILQRDNYCCGAGYKKFSYKRIPIHPMLVDILHEMNNSKKSEFVVHQNGRRIKISMVR